MPCSSPPSSCSPLLGSCLQGQKKGGLSTQQLFVVGALVPTLLLAGLWLISRRTIDQYEKVGVGNRDGERAAHPDSNAVEVGPDSRLMWSNDQQVRRLRALHMQCGAALVPAGVIFYCVIALGIRSYTGRGSSTTWSRFSIVVWSLLVGTAVVQTIGLLADEKWLDLRGDPGGGPPPRRDWAIEVGERIAPPQPVPSTRLTQLEGLGAYFAVWTLLLLVALGAAAFRVPATRRSLGILWAVASFWPRAAHPLAPPCYAERAVPDLVTRISWYRNPPDDRTVIVAGNSQGSVLGAAAIFYLNACDEIDDGPLIGGIGFLSFGSVLRRLYGRYFPVYSGPVELSRLQQILTSVAVGPAHGRPLGLPRWRNLWRYTDYLGGQLTSGPPPYVPVDAESSGRSGGAAPTGAGRGEGALGVAQPRSADVRSAGRPAPPSTIGCSATPTSGVTGRGTSSWRSPT